MNSNLDREIYLLSDTKVAGAKNLPVFEIETLPQKIDFDTYAALIFTSKNAVYSLDSMTQTWKEKPSYAIAPQTAKSIKQRNGRLAFTGQEKHGNGFALELCQKLKNQKVLYVRGAEVVSDIVNILNNHDVYCDDIIVYKTVCKKFDTEVFLPKKSSIIFSSPSTINCFFKHIHWDESFNAIAIGHTTAHYFPPYITPIIADTTSLESCVKKAIEIQGLTDITAHFG